MFEFSRPRTVYGTLLNHRDALDALGNAVHQPPYKAPPVAPVLYIKPRNTWVGDGEAVVVPDGVDQLEIGATLGVVIGQSACRVGATAAMACVAGYVIVVDIRVPHDSYYRPALRLTARDTFCPIGAWVSAARVADPDALPVTVSCDGIVVQRSSTAGLIRPVARLIADVSEFMTLSPCDVLSVGVPAGAPQARAGQRVTVSIDGLGQISNPLVAEGTTT